MARLDWRRRYGLVHWALDNLHAPDAQEPEDWPVCSRLLTGGILPVYCGEYAPGLTGLYAIVNGLKLLLAEIAPLKPSEEQFLLEVGWNFITGRETIAPHRGTRLNSFTRMAEAMAFALSRRRADWIQCEPVHFPNLRPKSMQSFMERSVVAEQVSLILLGRGHYTVVRGYTLESWLLFDATGRQWMLRRGIGRAAIFKPILLLSRVR